MKTTIQGCLVRMTDESREVLEDLIRRFESATRYAYARLCDGTPGTETYKGVTEKFDLNAMWACNVIVRARGTFAAAKRLSARGKLESPKKLIWGGRKNFKLRCEGKITAEEWRSARSSQLCAVGDKNRKGNQNLRILAKDGYRLRISVGVRRWMICQLWIPKKYRAILDEHLRGEPRYTVRIKRGQDNRYRVYISFEATSPEISADFSQGAIGVDLNPSGQAWVETNSKGQLLKRGWVNTPELQYARRGRRDSVIGQVAHRIVDVARAANKGIVLERLKFKRDGNGGRYHKRNRIFNNFVFGRLTQAIVREAGQQGVAVRQVNPAFSSYIGKMKYMKTYPHLGEHEAAAYVLARRGLGFLDMPVGRQRRQAEKSLEERLGKSKLRSWAYWRALKSGADSANKKTSRTIREGMQGVAPTCSDGGIPSRYRGKGVLA